MNAINELVRSTIDKNTLQECSVDELQQLTQQYPYFGPAQFLLAKKLKEEGSSLYEQQSQRAILYFQDHLWFNYLSGDNHASAAIVTAKPMEATIAAEPVIVKEVYLKEEIKEQPVTEEKIAEPAAFIETPAQEEEEITEEIINEPVAEPVIESVPEAREEPQVVVEVPEEPVLEEVIAPLVSNELVTTINEQPANEPTKNISGTTLPGFKIQAMDKSAAALTFEPYHTVDYFASLGIKFREEEKPKDRFGQQLKSFTQWLKAIKKLPEGEIANAAVPADDKKVTQLAEHSIENQNVVTEAMAEVWEKQGNAPKAIDTYRKLSLLNPAKSSYFAAKIDHLKNL
ncbi:MAG: hypothetical protein ABI480_06065 [Chitinophagaceae bacterium]